MKRNEVTILFVIVAFLAGALVSPPGASGEAASYRLAVFDAQRVISESKAGRFVPP